MPPDNLHLSPGDTPRVSLLGCNTFFFFYTEINKNQGSVLMEAVTADVCVFARSCSQCSETLVVVGVGVWWVGWWEGIKTCLLRIVPRLEAN